MTRKTRTLGVVTAVALAAGSLGVSVPAAASGGVMTTCMITGVGLGPTSQGTIMGEVGATQNCVGAFLFLGVNPAAYGYPKPTVNNFAELAVILRQWVPADGHPGMWQWVKLSPAVATGMQAAGINPTAFLQWLASSAGGQPWPPFLAKPACLPLVNGNVPASANNATCANPLKAVGVAPSKTAAQAAASATQPTATDGVPHTTAVKPAPAPVAKPSTPVSSSVPTEPKALEPKPPTPGTETVAQAMASASASAAANAPPPPVVLSPSAQPPDSETFHGVTVPCEMDASCAADLNRHIQYETSRWGRFRGAVAGFVQNVPGWVTRDTALLAVGACLIFFGIRYWIHRRRNWYWY